MAQPALEVFRLVALRGPDTALTTAPADQVSRDLAVRRLRELGSKLASAGWLNNAQETADDLRNLPKPLDSGDIGALAWSSVADAFATDPTIDLSKVLLKTKSGDEVDLQKYARRLEFAADEAELTLSWLTLELRARMGLSLPDSVLVKHQNALKFAAVIHSLASEGKLEEPAVVFGRPLVLPEGWRRLRHPDVASSEPDESVKGSVQPQAMLERIRQLRGFVRPSTLSASRFQEEARTGGRAVRVAATLPEGPQKWAADSTRVVQEAALLRSVLVKATVLRDSGAFRNSFPKFLNALRDNLSLAEKAVFKTFMNGHSTSDFTSLAIDLDNQAGAKLVTANELCRKMRIFQEEQEELLPLAQVSHSAARPAIRALGWGDLLVIRDELVGYEAGEISHIENALAGESSSRKHDRRHGTEVLSEDETTTVTFTENQLATTDRFEIQAESAQTIASNFSLQAGVNTSGKYGLTQVDTSVAAELSRSTDESTRSAQTTAHEVVNSAVNRTQQTVRALRRTLTTDSIRELTKHAINNTKDAVGGKPQPRTDIYRWVNKVERLQMYEYGKRLMIEFTIPEPGVSLIEAGQPIRPSVPRPLPLGIGPSDISEGNYLCLADRYQARNVPTPPPLLMQVGAAFATQPNYEESHKSAGATDKRELPIPPGYLPMSGRFACTSRGRTQEKADANDPSVGLDLMHAHMAVGGEKILDSTDQADVNYEPQGGRPSYNGTFVLHAPTLTDDHGIPITVRWTGPDDNIATMNVYITCRRGAGALDAWRLEVYEHLLDAHARLEAAYQDAMRQAEFDQTDAEQAFGNRPSDQNRALERTELKKWAIKLMRSVPFTFDSVIGHEGVQEIDPVSADLQAPVVRFFEEAFEWEQMTYMFAPYFWGRRRTWTLRQNLSVPNDPRHEAFLRAGSARTIVPVTAGQEARVLAYLESDTSLPEWGSDLAIEDWDPAHPSQRIPPTKLDTNTIAPGDRLFPDLWLEIIDEYKRDVLRGSGKAEVTQGNAQVRLLESVSLLDKRDVGREIYIDADRYQIESVQSGTKLTLDRPYQGASGQRVYATGPVPRGAPWEVRVPTNLLALSSNASALASIP
ncbi:hypothetical protein J2Y41_003471 [Arthrobacter sp. 1088]|uniref:hypothetical protein n=1 Tax=Arthrobacter sp. 1088 TaxID=2817768 RepID=UPI0028594CE7|nr:hypothetical protein [Arthrobacter sp. 1088]MDR6687895.1 hypothetical protein [Arthrobacter sp. 1088]